MKQKKIASVLSCVLFVLGSCLLAFSFLHGENVLQPCNATSLNATVFSSSSTVEPNSELADVLTKIFGQDSSFNAENSEALAHRDTLNLSNLGLSSIVGLEFYSFPKLKTLLLDGNNISSISASNFSNMPVLETLNLSNNNLTSVDFAVFSPQTIVEINLFENSITHGDFSGVSKQATINLSSNKIESCESIAHSAENSPLFLLAFNKIVEAENFLPNFELLVQNVRLNMFEETEIDVFVFESELFPSFNAITVMNGKESELTNGKNILSFGVHEFSFFNGETKLEEDWLKMCCTVMPTNPSFAVFNGSDETEIQQVYTHDVSVQFFSSIENAEIWVRVDQGEWQQTNVAHVAISGNFSISAKAVCEGVSSKKITFSFSIKKNASFWLIFFAVGSFLAMIAIAAAYLFRSTKKSSNIKY